MFKAQEYPWLLKSLNRVLKADEKATKNCLESKQVDGFKELESDQISFNKLNIRKRPSAGKTEGSNKRRRADSKPTSFNNMNDLSSTFRDLTEKVGDVGIGEMVISAYIGLIGLGPASRVLPARS